MKGLNKTQRQIREYNKLAGFTLIVDKYTSCIQRIRDKNKKVGDGDINKDFLIFCTKTRIKCKMGTTNKNYYERLWIQEYNKLKKK
jgi:hypothetical protein